MEVDSWNIEVYYGKESDYHTPDADVAADEEALTKSEEIVVKMLSGLLDMGRHCITDNWYTSIRLAQHLLTRATDLTGVVKASRGVPECLKIQKLKPKQSSFMRNGDILVVKYEDRKPVYSLTTRYTAELVEKSKPFHGKVYFKLPLQINFYNEYMGSVDRADQLLKPYASDRKALT